MTTAVVLFATAGGIIPPSPSEQEIWDSFDPPEIPEGRSDLWLYRERTVMMLRRYMRLSGSGAVAIIAGPGIFSDPGHVI